MTASALSDSLNAATTAAGHSAAMPWWAYSLGMFVVLLFVAIAILASYRIDEGPGLKQLLEGRRK